jgi:hypothetical protein
MVDETPRARQMWTLLEPVHAVTYFAAEARETFERNGLRGFWRGYFAGRAAPLGAVGPGVVTAVFYTFAPRMVRRALPDVWDRAAPPVALAARVEGAAAALRCRMPADPAPIVALLERAAAGLDCAGRVLGAANAELPAATDPYERLWQLATLFREHRGDGHYATVLAAGLDGCETLAWRASLDLDRTVLQASRGWTDEEWDAAERRLMDRGWLDRDGTATEEARQAQVAVEEATDRAAARPWQALPAADLATLVELLSPLAATVDLPQPNPIGLPNAGTVAAAEGARS